MRGIPRESVMSEPDKLIEACPYERISFLTSSHHDPFGTLWQMPITSMDSYNALQIREHAFQAEELEGGKLQNYGPQPELAVGNDYLHSY